MKLVFSGAGTGIANTDDAMNVSLYQAAAALNANDHWQEIIAQNLASSGVPGFKKQDVSFAAVEAGLVPTGSPNGVSHLSMPTTQSVTNFQQGQLRPTGVNTDVALDGSGFFAVQLPNGDTAYTRDGEFQINAQGQLVTKQGYTVLTDGGAIEIDLNNPAPLSISSDGTASQGTDVKGKLKLVSFSDPHTLTPVGSSYFLARNSKALPTDATDTSVRQGFLEASNATPVAEMAHMIAAMRQFETSQRVLQMHDDRMGRAITELGNPNPA